MKTKALMHRHGGRINEITGIGHETDASEGRAYYYFTGNVEWLDGSKSEAHHIEPFLIVLDEEQIGESEREYIRISDALADYLREKGEWQKRGDYRTWVPYFQTGRIGIDGPRWVKVPTRFLADHIDRGLPTPSVRNYCPLKRDNYIDANDADIDQLISDARFYAHKDGPDQAGTLRRSAQALLRALARENLTTGEWE